MSKAKNQPLANDLIDQPYFVKLKVKIIFQHGLIHRDRRAGNAVRREVVELATRKQLSWH